ncbi:hypothetical protein [Salinigranum sp. GCM10025319]|uniref:hypothetical protein n=1 Tax=Salinigranum sp. GCM10025319 TaxID=3252687 RepID=UPI00361B56F9
MTRLRRVADDVSIARCLANPAGVARRDVLRILPATVFAGCAAPTRSEPFAGRYSWGFEESVFAPCDGDERWWVVDDAELVRRYRAVAADYEQVFARLRGELSEPGRYGQGGQYPRQFRVTAVLTVRPIEDGDCRPTAFASRGRDRRPQADQ